jgi:hypothetical protein
VVVVGHETVRVASPVEALAHISAHPQEQLPVAINAVDVLTTVIARLEPLLGELQRGVQAAVDRHGGAARFVSPQPSV